MKTFNGPIHFR